MAAQRVPHPSTDRKRVKVYELRNNDWFDRGTGFCTAAWNITEDGQHKDPRVVVESEDQPERMLLETRICKEDGFHKQQETLIVWTEPSDGIDMALSFQEAEGCANIWHFIHHVQQQYLGSHQDDSLSDDVAVDVMSSVQLPPATLATLPDIEQQMRMMSASATGRDALTKYVMTEDFIGKLIPLVGEAEDLEGLNELHRLCNIMKIIILLNDTSIIEHAVSDECVIGVVGALEYDPDFPSHKANHRQWLEGEGRYKEVVRIDQPQILRKIHQTYRLQYLKDVVLARILDDNTFSVLNSLIFFNQVDIVQHLQANGNFLTELFQIFKPGPQEPKRKKEAVLFIQQCCAIAKNLQPPARLSLYTNFINHGLLAVIHFGLRHADVAVRVGATDILVAMIDHDPQMMRQTVYRQLSEKQPPLTDSLIELLLVEVDLGVKSQASDALKVLVDQQGPSMQHEAFVKANPEYAARAARIPSPHDPHQNQFLDLFYQKPVQRLFQPLLELKGREKVEFSVQQAPMFTYLIEILCFFIRQHNHRAKYFIMHFDVVPCVTKLLGCRDKFLKLVAIRFIRQLLGLNDEFYMKQLINHGAIGPLLDVLLETMPRDNLVSSACLEFFDTMKKENYREVAKHAVETYREKCQALDYLELFELIILRYDHTRAYTVNLELLSNDDESGSRIRRLAMNPRQGAMMEHITIDQAEEEYWNTSDDEEDSQDKEVNQSLVNGDSFSSSKSLVDYDSDENPDDNADAGALSADEDKASTDGADDKLEDAADKGKATAPPERLSEKRRREEDEEDDLSKTVNAKRRNSSSASSTASSSSNPRSRRRSGLGAREGHQKIAISLSAGTKAGHMGDDA